jgi:hypothetical protein
MVDDAQNARPHRVDGRVVEPKRAVPRQVRGMATLLQASLGKYHCLNLKCILNFHRKSDVRKQVLL